MGTLPKPFTDALNYHFKTRYGMSVVRLQGGWLLLNIDLFEKFVFAAKTFVYWVFVPLYMWSLMAYEDQ